VENLKNGTARESLAAGASIVLTNTEEYSLTLAEDHHFTPLLGQEYVYDFSTGFDAATIGFTDSRLMKLEQGRADMRSISSSKGEHYYNSLFGRLEYAYSNRYFADVSLRMDESSKFGPRNRRALFWSARAMWRAKEEAWLRSVAWLDELTLKASVGTSGNSAIGEYAWQGVVEGSDTYKGRAGYGVANPGNSHLTWERQLNASAGLAVGVFGRVKAEVGFYHRRTSSMLLNVPQPYSSGFDSQLQNIGVLTNTGLDFRLDVAVWKDGKGNHITPYLVFNYNRQRVVELFNGLKYWIKPGTGVAWAVGKPVELFYPRFYRVNPDNGNPEWYMANPSNPAEPQADPSRVTDDPTMRKRSR